MIEVMETETLGKSTPEYLVCLLFFSSLECDSLTANKSDSLSYSDRTEKSEKVMQRGRG